MQPAMHCAGYLWSGGSPELLRCMGPRLRGDDKILHWDDATCLWHESHAALYWTQRQLAL